MRDLVDLPSVSFDRPECKDAKYIPHVPLRTKPLQCAPSGGRQSVDRGMQQREGDRARSPPKIVDIRTGTASRRERDLLGALSLGEVKKRELPILEEALQHEIL